MPTKSSLISRGFRVARPALLTAVLFSLFINLLAFVGPLYMLQIYDRVIPTRNHFTLYALTGIAFFLLLVYAALEKVRSAVLIRGGLLFDSEARSSLFEVAFLGSVKEPSGAYYSVLRDLDVIREFLTGPGFISFCDAPWVFIFVGACFFLHPVFGLIATFGAVLIFALALANEYLTRGRLKEAELNGNLSRTFAAATFRNVEVMQAMGMWRPLRDRWLARHNRMLSDQAIASDRAGWLFSTIKFTRAFLQIAILGAGAYLAIIQESTPAAMIAASIIMGRALAPVELAVSQWKALLAARSAWGRIDQLEKLSPVPLKRTTLTAPLGALSVQNLFVAPPLSQRPVLRGISFSLDAGTALGITGPSAAGKSSLARAIVGVWPIIGGSVRIDGSELVQWDRDQLSQYIGYLPQDVELFAGSIAENIARFNPTEDARVVAAAEIAGADAMIKSLIGGYNTQIGDSGLGLSGGQRQRVGLARALFGMPPLVVLDEPNSSLDDEGEMALKKALERLRLAKRTVVIITHSANLLARMDKILVLEQGLMRPVAVQSKTKGSFG